MLPATPGLGPGRERWDPAGTPLGPGAGQGGRPSRSRRGLRGASGGRGMTGGPPRSDCHVRATSQTPGDSS